MKKEYTLSSTAWPESVWKAGREEHLVEELSLSITEGDKLADFSFRWLRLQIGKPPALELRAFTDAWFGLEVIRPFLLINEGDPSPAEVIKKLVGLGFRPSRYHDQNKRVGRGNDRREFERLKREHPEWLQEEG